jgi:hypothetical protein
MPASSAQAPQQGRLLGVEGGGGGAAFFRGFSKNIIKKNLDNFKKTIVYKKKIW